MLNTSSLSSSWSQLHPYYSYAVSIVTVTTVGLGPNVDHFLQMPEAGKQFNLTQAPASHDSLA